MALRDDLKTWIARKIWQSIDTQKGDVVTSDRWDELFNLLIQQGDDTAETLKDTLTMLYETVLDDTDGADHVMAEGQPLKDYVDGKYPEWSINLGSITLYVGETEPANPSVNDIWIDTTQEM